jgi:transposase
MFHRIYTSLEIKNAIECYDRVKSYRKAEKLTSISKSTIHRWYNTFHSLVVRSKQQLKKCRKTRKQKFPEIVQLIQEIFAETDKLTVFSLREIQCLLLNKGIKASISWIYKMVKKARISRRSFKETHKVCSNKPQHEHYELMKKFKQVIDNLDDSHIVCVDETGFCNVGNSTIAYYPKGKKPSTIQVPKRDKVSLIMAVHPSKGVVSSSIQTQAFNTNSFCEFLSTKLIPILPVETKVLLMDNVAFHKSHKVTSLLQSHGIEPLFIPPYSPRCNPIEEVFSLFKRYFRISYISHSFHDAINLSQKKVNENSVVISQYYKHTRQFLNTRCST